MPQAEGALAVSVNTRARATDPNWFQAQVITPFLQLIEGDLDREAVALAEAATHAYVITAEVADPDDLAHVQAAWALAKCVAEAGASLIIDATAARAFFAEEIASLPPGRGFEILREVTMFVEEVTHADGTTSLVAWTAGMQKFGRPNLVLPDIAPEYGAVAAHLLRDAAAVLAAGERVEPGDELHVGANTFCVNTFVPEAHIAVELPAIVLSEKDHTP